MLHGSSAEFVMSDPDVSLILSPIDKVQCEKQRDLTLVGNFLNILLAASVEVQLIP